MNQDCLRYYSDDDDKIYQDESADEECTTTAPVRMNDQQCESDNIIDQDFHPEPEDVAPSEQVDAECDAAVVFPVATAGCEITQMGLQRYRSFALTDPCPVCSAIMSLHPHGSSTPTTSTVRAVVVEDGSDTDNEVDMTSSTKRVRRAPSSTRTVFNADPEGDDDDVAVTDSEDDDVYNDAVSNDDENDTDSGNESDTNDAKATSMGCTKRVSAPSPPVPAAHRVLKTRFKAMKAIQAFTLSTTDRATIERALQRHEQEKQDPQKRKKKGSSKPLSAHRLEKQMDRIVKANSQIQSCCANRDSGVFQDADYNAIAPHPFTSPVVMVTTRLKLKHNLKSTCVSTITSVLATPLADRGKFRHTNQKDNVSRDVVFDTKRVCVACFLAWTDLSESTIRRAVKVVDVYDTKLGVHVLSGTRASPKLAQCMRILSSLLETEVGETLPTNQGSNTHQSLQMPYSSNAAFLQACRERLLLDRSHPHMQPTDAEIANAKKNVTTTTMQRAIHEFETKFNLRLSFAKTKKFMRCSACDRLDHDLRAAFGKDAKNKAARAKAVHIHQAICQRKEYERLRDHAKTAGTDTWVLSTDGMDQSKTTAPHTKQETKDTDSLQGLGMHVVSTVVFGAPEPLLGFVNLDDVAKNSALTVATLMRTLEIQWEKTLENAAKGGKPATWPKRLHICFDNAQGENLNRNVFMMLAILVHHGVFEYITVGTLLVGHTHNINDQMFSVWSKYLDRNDALSVAAMMRAFEDNYHSKMSALSSAMREELAELQAKKLAKNQAKRDRHRARDNDGAYNNVPLRSESTPLSETSSSSLQRAASQSSVAAVQGEVIDHEAENAIMNREPEQQSGPIEQINHNIKCLDELGNLASRLDSKPHMEIVEDVPDIAAWAGQMNHTTAYRGKKKVKTTLFKKFAEAFKALGWYHVFMFKKDSVGNTILLRRFTVNSASEYKAIPHPETADDTGTREYFRTSHIILGKSVNIKNDPMRMPKRPVNTKSCAARVEEMVAGGKYNITAGVKREADSDAMEVDPAPTHIHELAEIKDEMMKLDAGAKNETCAACRSFMKAQADIGVISAAPRDASVVDKQVEKDKKKERGDSQRSHMAHMADPAQAHRHDVMDGWWTHWIPRARMIKTMQRGSAAVDDAPTNVDVGGLLVHPDDMTKSARALTENVQRTIMSKIGPPHGQLHTADGKEDKDGGAPHIVILRAPSVQGVWVGEVVKYFTPSQGELLYQKELDAYDQELQVYEEEMKTRQKQAEVVRKEAAALKRKARKDPIAPHAAAPLPMPLVKPVLPPPPPPSAAQPCAMEEWIVRKSVDPYVKRGKNVVSQAPTPAAAAIAAENLFTRTHVLIQWFTYTHDSHVAASRAEERRVDDIDSEASDAVESDDERRCSDDEPLVKPLFRTQQSLDVWKALKYVSTNEHRDTLIPVDTLICWGSKNAMLKKTGAIRDAVWALVVKDLTQRSRDGADENEEAVEDEVECVARAQPSHAAPEVHAAAAASSPSVPAAPHRKRNRASVREREESEASCDERPVERSKKRKPRIPVVLKGKKRKNDDESDDESDENKAPPVQRVQPMRLARTASVPMSQYEEGSQSEDSSDYE